MEGIENYIFVAALLIIVIIITYIFNKLTMKSKKCATIKQYNNYTPIALSDLSVSATDTPNKSMFDVSLNSVFVKTAYNCCCTGNFKNDYVDTCALENCYNQGARALHFEVYLLNNKPVIASSSISQPKYKEIYNELDFYTTMKTVNKLFTSKSNDPLFLILEINSDKYKTYESVYNALYEIFGLNSVDGNRIMFFDSSTQNFGDVKLFDLIGKVVIMVSYKSGNVDNFNKSGLKNITTVNLSLSDKNKMIKYNTFINAISSLNEDQSLFVESISKYNNGITVLIPDKQAYNQNYDFISTGIRSGITFTALNFQYNDEQIKNYNKIFGSALIGTNSFLLKKNKNKDTNIYYSPSIQAFYKKKTEEITTPISSTDIELYNAIYK
jgi:hypothetical protein